jgi:cell division protein FtsL
VFRREALLAYQPVVSGVQPTTRRANLEQEIGTQQVRSQLNRNLRSLYYNKTSKRENTRINHKNSTHTLQPNYHVYASRQDTKRHT